MLIFVYVYIYVTMDNFRSQNMEPLKNIYIYCIFSSYASKSKYAFVKYLLYFMVKMCWTCL